MTRRRGFARAAAAALLALSAASARGDGGRMRLHQTAGPFTLTVFTAPEPLTVGRGDVSVLVQDAITGDVVLDADVTVRVKAVDGSQTRSYSAVAGRNRLLRSATVELPFAGRWHLEMAVHRGSQEVIVRALVPVESARSRWRTAWPFLAAPAILVALFLAGARRRRRT